MALDFNAASRFVDHGSAASLDNLPSASGITGIAWVYRTVDAANQGIISKTAGTTVGFEFIVNNAPTNGVLRLLARFGTTNLNFISSANVVPLNTWTMVAFTFSGTTAKLYFGNLSTAVAEVSYNTSTAGVGTYGADAASNLYVGNRQRDPTTGFFQGRVGRAAIYNRVLTSAEIEAHRLCWAPLDSGCVMMTQYEGTGTQSDVSGNGNTGAVTGAVQADGVTLPGVAITGDTALGLGKAFALTAGMSTTALTAFGLGWSYGVGRSDVTNSALGLAAAFAKATGQASETDSALGLVGRIGRTVGLSSEANTAFSLAGSMLGSLWTVVPPSAGIWNDNEPGGIFDGALFDPAIFDAGEGAGNWVIEVPSTGTWG